MHAMPRKRKGRNDDPLESISLQVTSNLKSRSIIATKLQSIKDSNSNFSKNVQKPTEWCPHCSCNLSIKTFKKHKSLHFVQNEWLTTEELPESFVNEDIGITMICMHTELPL